MTTIPTPECNTYYEMPSGTGGRGVAARIRYANGLWQATLDGRTLRASADPARASMVMRVWREGRRISEAEHAYLVQNKERMDRLVRLQAIIGGYEQRMTEGGL